jgi:hypothetical protein
MLNKLQREDDQVAQMIEAPLTPKGYGDLEKAIEEVYHLRKYRANARKELRRLNKSLWKMRRLVDLYEQLLKIEK